MSVREIGWKRTILRQKMFLYRQYKAEIEEYEQNAIDRTPVMDESGIHGTGISDPTAKSAAMLADVPKNLEEKKAWVDSIEQAKRRVEGWDKAYEIVAGRGLSYVMTEYYCMNSEPRPKASNEQVRARLCEECQISESTFYRWLNKIDKAVWERAYKHKIFPYLP